MARGGIRRVPSRRTWPLPGVAGGLAAGFRALNLTGCRGLAGILAGRRRHASDGSLLTRGCFAGIPARLTCPYRSEALPIKAHSSTRHQVTLTTLKQLSQVLSNACKYKVNKCNAKYNASNCAAHERHAYIIRRRSRIPYWRNAFAPLCWVVDGRTRALPFRLVISKSN